jgi:hypothetical protein
VRLNYAMQESLSGRTSLSEASRIKFHAGGEHKIPFDPSVELALAFNAGAVSAGQDDKLTAFFPEPGCEVSWVVENLSRKFRSVTTKCSATSVVSVYP